MALLLSLRSHMRQSSLAKSGVAARVLLVDDNRDGLMARKSLLDEQGFITTTAINGEEAFEALSKVTFDLMVTDFKMPKMNGIELIDALVIASGAAHHYAGVCGGARPG
jgi:CheY-like chemotaxis protein